jgi:hypothetical protein
MLFMTQYRVTPLSEYTPSITGTTTLFARDIFEAEQFVKQRNLGEALCTRLTDHSMRPFLCSELIRRFEVEKAMHAACWLGMIATKCGLSESRSLLDDLGIVHQLAHCIEEKYLGRYYFPALNALYPNVAKLEQRVPGMWPCDEEDFLLEDRQRAMLQSITESVFKISPSDTVIAEDMQATDRMVRKIRTLVGKTSTEAIIDSVDEELVAALKA